MELDQKHYLERQDPLINIAADSQIPDIEHKLSEVFTADYALSFFESDQITPKDLKNIDALLVRSTVNVDEDLCKFSNIQYVGSATAGINHLDTNYLDNQNITWSHASGCNANSVTHFVMAVIGELIQEGLFNVRQTVGIVGYGNIGKRLYQLLAALNIKVFACDPFLSDSELVEMDQILKCDLITIHAPYSTSGLHPTKNLINQSHISDLKNKILINTSRGGIVLEDLAIQIKELIYIADVWMNEPIPSHPLIQEAFLSTPHIAGYSIEGRSNGSSIIANSCAKFFGCQDKKQGIANSLLPWPHSLEAIVRDIHGHGFPVSLFNAELDLIAISKTLKALQIEDLSDGFNSLRAKHPARHDFNTYSFENLSNLDEEINLDFFDRIKSFN